MLAGHKWTTVRGTNLQVPVNDPVNMAVMDTLQDLLYAVAEHTSGTSGVGDSDEGNGEKKATQG